ncbi:hypothetical protein PC129_g21361 [Phytophthora cactorum]|uniref:Uncharacterized protein n=1 Tax=Phytophthora cactorum TaxID=29920 RepID=A0A329T2D6_9STRA|nr:hypothetical protein PC112_g22326 [Phytophthora cactorum]KAG2796391.1 hypothetical protein PC111_g21745 [Phytophthora cactorum]KAG2823387.1 hypothetical protein PC113_g22192 [Phytophthora cactorum]KAG2875902.1 hypothetical protein PC114_g24474 [Phytophthora cactorum]KAG2889393.1 hypothetical protein PC115_g19766 [Phytophthora cactorum]
MVAACKSVVRLQGEGADDDAVSCEDAEHEAALDGCS